MSASAIAARARAPGLSLTTAAMLALIAVALATQLTLGMTADVAWLIHCNLLWLDGAVPYRDFVEINPPASLLLYWPAVAAARALDLRPELAVSAFGFGLAALAFGLGAALLRGARIAPTAGIAAVAALVVLPGETFCERDHLAAVLGLPFVALAFARAQGLRPSVALALAAGVGAGAMAAIKPPYAIVGVLLALYQGRRDGVGAVLRSPEYYAAGAVGLAYVGLVAPLFPDYVARVLPVGVDVYVVSRVGLAALAASPGATVTAAIVLTALASARRRDDPGLTVALLATLGAALAYFVQGKGWIYQAVPAAMFATLAGAFALEGWERRGWALTLGAVVAAAATPAAHNLGLGLLAGLAAGAAFEALRDRVAPDLRRLAPLGLAAAVGAACGVCTLERPPTPELEATLARLGPGLTLATLSEDMGLGWPLTRRLGAIWALHRPSLFVNADAGRVVAGRAGDAALSARVSAHARAELDEALADIAARKPDALLVGPTGTALHADLWADPAVQAVIADYRRVATEARPGYTAELWLRKGVARDVN